jgi:hypothetical protein
MTDDEARKLPVRIDAATLESFGSSTWMTDAGPLDLLVELRDRDAVGIPIVSSPAVRFAMRWARVTVLLASLDDIIASKEHAGRAKGLEGYSGAS